jgi:nudix-type nucleoside diphosphatase (YffH/AdpP family)
MNETAKRVRVVDVRTLSDNWYLLKTTTFDFLRADGTWQRQSRETYDRGNGAALLLYDGVRRTVVLTRQFRFPAFVNGHDGMLIEAPAGLLDRATPEARIRAEAEEETGYRVGTVRKIFEAFMSPGSVTEKLYFFVAEYNAAARSGNGVASEGEASVELPFATAACMVESGEIADGKTHHAVICRAALFPHSTGASPMMILVAALSQWHRRRAALIELNPQLEQSHWRSTGVG